MDNEERKMEAFNKLVGEYLGETVKASPCLRLCSIIPCSSQEERESTFYPELMGAHVRISGLTFFCKVDLKKGVSKLEYYNPHPYPPPTVDKKIPYPLQEKQVQYFQCIGAGQLLFVAKMEQH